MRAVFNWAADEKNEKRYVATNPERELERLKFETTGYHSWTPEEVEQFVRAHPIGTKARVKRDTTAPLRTADEW